MVLIRWSLVFALAAGCAPKAPPVAAATPVAVDVALVSAPMGDVGVRGVPATLADSVDALLRARNLAPAPLAPEAWTEAFAGRRTAASRVAWLADRPGASAAVLVVDLEPRYFSFISGRYRWTVAVTATLRDVAHPDDEATAEFEVPVMLTWDHEREDAAVAAATPVIERRLGELVDDWIGGR